MTVISRRSLMSALGGAVIGGALGVTGRTAQAFELERFEQQGGLFSWKPCILDPDQCAPVAYDGYWHDGLGCGYGAFYAIVGTMGEKFGAPYNTFPFSMLEVGKGGTSDFGTLCGALLGAASAMALFWGRRERDPMVTELFRWYEQTPHPEYDPGAGAKGVAGKIPTSISDSVLCHVSVSRWCYQTGFAEKSKERGERCARITADVAIKAIEIMNAKQRQDFLPAYSQPESVAYCNSCHGPGKESPIYKGVMECTPCHSGSEHTANKFVKHP
ncbi:split-Soret cytochrome c [Desulfonatronovibrio hydrogenovorans]|uniref:split-Soret cytochrome c n=1 Tax=Desulfonatronovibrio hydrogenovorans TaxID=53245 RepID=UPI00048D5194|nr:C-GCAxxG-C-C family protein [Desulfonatronovibrio hydrogenovorans]